MKAMTLTGIRQMELVDVPDPVISSDTDVLLKMERVGVCGSDVHYYTTGRIGSQVVTYPFTVGHECSATVAAVGSKVTRVKSGDRVAVDPATACHQCDQCLQGRENTCRKLRFLGCPGQAEGCLSEYIVMPQDSLYRLPKTVSLNQAVLAEPLSIGVYAARHASLSDSSHIAVLGAGPIGLSALLAARAEGIAGAYATDKIDERVEIARDHGAIYAGNPDRTDVVAEILERHPAGMDAVFECAGEQDAIDQCIELLKPGGRLMLIGIPRVERISFIIDQIRRKEIIIINVRRQNECVQSAIDLLASGRIDADFMITHRFKFAETQAAFDLVDTYSDGVVKAMIEL